MRCMLTVREEFKVLRFGLVSPDRVVAAVDVAAVEEHVVLAAEDGCAADLKKEENGRKNVKSAPCRPMFSADN